MAKILYLVANDAYFCSHRLNLAKAAMNAGHTVAVATRCDKNQKRIENEGIQVFPLKHLTRSGINPWHQWLALSELITIYKQYQPDIVHQVAMKPVILGSLAAKWCKVPKIVNALGGLGYLFTERSPRRGGTNEFILNFTRIFACRLLRWIFLSKNAILILQNQDDINTLESYNVIPKKMASSKIALIKGSGVNLEDFPLLPFPASPPIIITCAARMLWDKGIGELVDAAKLLKKENVPVKIILYGSPDPDNPESIEISQLKTWHDEEIVEWYGHTEEMAKAYAECHIAVLPSYREGLPKTLLEAMSCGRPIVTTDVPGCREVVKHDPNEHNSNMHNSNGIMVPPKNPEALFKALADLIENEDLIKKMGQKSREIVEKNFSDAIIHQQILNLYQ